MKEKREGGCPWPAHGQGEDGTAWVLAVGALVEGCGRDAQAWWLRLGEMLTAGLGDVVVHGHG